MARRRGVWAEIQRERALQLKRQQQAVRANDRALKQAVRDQQRAQREAERRAALNDKERKRLYIEERKTAAAELTAEIDARIAELDSVLVDGIDNRVDVSFESLKQDVEIQVFDPAGLEVPLPPPDWADFAPKPPRALRLAFGGAAKHDREVAARRADFDQACLQHAATEADRRRRLEERRRLHEHDVAASTAAVRQRNASVDEFEQAVRAGEEEQVAELLTLVLDASQYPEGFPHTYRVIHRSQPKQVVVDYELPPQEVVPLEREHRYVQTRDSIDVVNRPVREVKERYARLVAEVALRTLHELFAADLGGVVDVVTFNGRVSTIDKATGQPTRPHLVSVGTTREQFESLVLTDLDPVVCLRHLNALVSRHPYDLEAVKPLLDFEALLALHRFVEGVDALANLDSRPDLLDMSPTEFEHFIRGLFETMGMEAWNTQASYDDGVDAVATNIDAVFGGLCIIQAKRYSRAVGVDAVRELIGAMDDKRATTGILVTTSWVANEGLKLARRNGRVHIIEGENLKQLCQEHLELDILIGLPKPPPRRRGA